MHLVSQALWIIAYGALAAAVAVIAHESAGWSWPDAGLAGALLFLALLHLLGIVRRRKERQDLDHRLMALYEDYQGALDTVDDLRREISALKESEGAGTSRAPTELVAEIRVLQTLLAQVVRKSAAPREHDPSRPEIEYRGDRTQTAEAVDPGADNTVSAQSSGRERGREEILEIIQNALEDNRVDLYLQPIVRLPSRKPLYYEAYSRVRDGGGQIIFPREYLPLAEESGLVGTLDNLLLFRCIQVIRRLGPRRPNVRFFCNISAASLSDKDFFPQFIDFMINNLELADRLVFEFSQASLRDQSPEVERSLASLGRRGFHFSMDHVTDLDLDPAGLSARHFSFVKVSAERLRHGAENVDIAGLCAAMARNEIDLIIEKIQEEQEVIDVLDYGIEFGQGYLFGEPRPSREDGGLNDAPDEGGS